MRQMNEEDFRKAFGLVAVGLMGLGASAIDITEDTTVTGEAIASYATAAINIADGKTLTLLNPTADTTFSGSLSGSGNFVIKADPAVAWIMTIAGNSPDFSGGVYISNLTFAVSSPAALGAAKSFTAHYGSDLAWKQSRFGGHGTYNCACDLQVRTYKDVARGLKLQYADTVLAGPVTWRGGRICGPGKVTGEITTTADMYACADVHLAGGIALGPSGKEKTLICDIGHVWVDKAPVTGYSKINNCTLHCGAENVFSWAPIFQEGAVFDLNGYDQTFRLNTLADSTLTSEKPAKLTVRNVRTSSGVGNLKGAVSLYLQTYVDMGADKWNLTLYGTDNTTTGTVTLVGKASKNVSSITMADGVCFPNAATFEIRSEGETLPKLIIPPGATATCKKSTLNLNGANSKVDVGEGGLLIVKDVFISDTKVLCGDYKAGDGSSLGGRMTGTGTIRVLGKRGLIICVR